MVTLHFRRSDFVAVTDISLAPPSPAFSFSLRPRNFPAFALRFPHLPLWSPFYVGLPSSLQFSPSLPPLPPFCLIFPHRQKSSKGFRFCSVLSRNDSEIRLCSRVISI
ncbi:hypothetical protein ACOSP7_016667 [Xanthoceras sorbifolium]